jgi:DNA-directed RNA polymerase specialized sigma24 family protein
VNEGKITQMEWALTREAFETFLSGLDADPERAGEKYEAIRRKLIRIFDWRGAHFPEECADETINRVIRKLAAGQTIRDIPTYCQGIARLVFLETLKKPDSRWVSLDELSSAGLPPSLEEDAARQDCFERCLDELPVESRQLIVQYHRDRLRDKINNRQMMAEQLGIPLNALRSRVQRIKDKLEQCLAGCLGGPSPRAGKK